MQVLRKRRFDLQQAADALEGAFLPARVTLQCCEEFRCIDDVDLGRVGRFGVRTGFWEEEGESVDRCVYFRRAEVFEILAVVMEHEEERARSRHRLYHGVDALLQLLHCHVFGLAEMIELGSLRQQIRMTMGRPTDPSVFRDEMIRVATVLGDN